VKKRSWGVYLLGCDGQADLNEDLDKCRHAQYAADQQDPRHGKPVAQGEFKYSDYSEREAENQHVGEKVSDCTG